jgi:protein-S-isoprenylcysteine O-methyltransferase Ste14
MPDHVPAKNSNQAVRYAALIGALVGALFARPVIKPWFDRHISFTPLENWPTLASFVPWIIFSIYWEIAAKNSAPAIKSETRFSRGIHVVLANAALLLIFFPVRGLNQRFLPDLLFIKVFGLAIECAGIALAVWARRILGRNWSGEITIKKDHELVRSGPYAIVRHPMYAGALIMIAGIPPALGSWWALIPAALLVPLIVWRLLREEAFLAANLAGYDDYRGRVRYRLAPSFW